MPSDDRWPGWARYLLEMGFTEDEVRREFDLGAGVSAPGQRRVYPSWCRLQAQMEDTGDAQAPLQRGRMEPETLARFREGLRAVERIVRDAVRDRRAGR